jgi:hypothetical protein
MSSQFDFFDLVRLTFLPHSVSCVVVPVHITICRLLNLFNLRLFHDLCNLYVLFLLTFYFSMRVLPKAASEGVGTPGAFGELLGRIIPMRHHSPAI